MVAPKVIDGGFSPMTTSLGALALGVPLVTTQRSTSSGSTARKPAALRATVMSSVGLRLRYSKPARSAASGEGMAASLS
jgi:hypothetical protein